LRDEAIINPGFRLFLGGGACIRDGRVELFALDKMQGGLAASLFPVDRGYREIP
jgi:hypothetical protein